MKIKNINLSLAILVSLMVLSFSFFVSAQNNSSTSNNVFLDSDQDDLTDQEEQLYGTDPNKADTDGDGYTDGAEVKSGYDPKKPAPDDKVTGSDPRTADAAKDALQGDNMTQAVASKISTLTSEASTDEPVNLEDVQALVAETLSSAQSQNVTISLPEIKKEDIKIQEQNYDNLSEEEAAQRKKDDFADYITAVFYILSSNSPKPLTSASDMSTVASSIAEEIINALNSRDTSALEDLNESGEKILEQLKDVEVPEDLVETHIKALRFAYYAQELEKLISPNTDDPLQDIANFSQIQAFLTSLISFTDDVQKKFSDYGLTLDDVTSKKLEDLGIDKSFIESLGE
jgi:hypothetical protein